METKKVSIRIDSNLFDFIEALATKYKLTITDVMINMVVMYFNDSKIQSKMDNKLKELFGRYVFSESRRQMTKETYDLYLVDNFRRSIIKLAVTNHNNFGDVNILAIKSLYDSFVNKVWAYAPKLDKQKNLKQFNHLKNEMNEAYLTNLVENMNPIQKQMLLK